MKNTPQNKKPSSIRTLRESELHYRRLFEAARDGILILDAETGLITDVNPFLITMLGYSREEFLEKKLWEVGAFQDIETSKKSFEELRRNEYIRYDNLPLKTRNGRLIQVEFISNMYQVGDKKVIQCNIRDISQRGHDEEKFEFVSIHDSLTDLYNHAYFKEEMSRLERGRLFPVSIVMIDVDGLKAINDHYGHAAGDNQLRRTAQIIIEAFRAEDVVARIGGDEFAVLLPGADSTAVEKAISRVKELVAIQNELMPGPALSISVGGATGDQSLVDTLNMADTNMYLEKQQKNKTSANNAL
jgi:diguanylate cyclase (GGDEF)-like protein/PAS domain S-box-containing protein